MVIPNNPPSPISFTGVDGSNGTLCTELFEEIKLIVPPRSVKRISPFGKNVIAHGVSSPSAIVLTRSYVLSEGSALFFCVGIPVGPARRVFKVTGRKGGYL